VTDLRSNAAEWTSRRRSRIIALLELPGSRQRLVETTGPGPVSPSTRRRGGPTNLIWQKPTPRPTPTRSWRTQTSNVPGSSAYAGGLSSDRQALRFGPARPQCGGIRQDTENLRVSPNLSFALSGQLCRRQTAQEPTCRGCAVPPRAPRRQEGRRLPRPHPAGTSGIVLDPKWCRYQKTAAEAAAAQPTPSAGRSGSRAIRPGCRSSVHGIPKAWPGGRLTSIGRHVVRPDTAQPTPQHACAEGNGAQ